MNASLQAVQPLIRTRQYRQFTDESVSDEQLHALTEVGRWSGSSRNSQPWRFIVIRDTPLIRALWQAGMPQTRGLETAMAAIAITLPDEEGRAVVHAYDEGRAAERILIAGSMLGLGAGIAWIRTDVRAAAAELLGLADDRFVRTIIAIGHPTADARAYRLPPGEARLPADELISWLPRTPSSPRAVPRS